MLGGVKGGLVIETNEKVDSYSPNLSTLIIFERRLIEGYGQFFRTNHNRITINNGSLIRKNQLPVVKDTIDWPLQLKRNSSPNFGWIVHSDNNRLNPRQDVLGDRMAYISDLVAKRNPNESLVRKLEAADGIDRINGNPWSIGEVKLTLGDTRLYCRLPSQFLSMSPGLLGVLGLSRQATGLIADLPQCAEKQPNLQGSYDYQKQIKTPRTPVVNVLQHSVVIASDGDFRGGDDGYLLVFVIVCFVIPMLGGGYGLYLAIDGGIRSAWTGWLVPFGRNYWLFERRFWRFSLNWPELWRNCEKNTQCQPLQRRAAPNPTHILSIIR